MIIVEEIKHPTPPSQWCLQQNRRLLDIVHQTDLPSVWERTKRETFPTGWVVLGYLPGFCQLCVNGYEAGGLENAASLFRYDSDQFVGFRVGIHGLNRRMVFLHWSGPESPAESREAAQRHLPMLYSYFSGADALLRATVRGESGSCSWKIGCKALVTLRNAVAIALGKDECECDFQNSTLVPVCTHYDSCIDMVNEEEQKEDALDTSEVVKKQPEQTNDHEEVAKVLLQSKLSHMRHEQYLALSRERHRQRIQQRLRLLKMGNPQICDGEE